MAIIETNIITLALKGQLIGAILTFKDDVQCVVQDFEYDPKTDIFRIQGVDDNVYPVHASKIGQCDVNNGTKPNGNKKKFKELK